MKHFISNLICRKTDEAWELPQVRRRGLRDGEVRSVCEEPRYGSVAAQPEIIPSTRMADRAAIEDGLPVLSLAVESCNLRRLYEQPQMRGREWEVPAFASYFDEGSLRFSSTIGFRLHGNNSRDRLRKSFRIYLRESYASPTERKRSGTSSLP